MTPSRNVTTTAHGFADYTIGTLLVIGPWLFGFQDHSLATMVTVGFGLTMIAYSLATDYELTVRRVIPLPAHLAFDAVSSGLLIASPFLFGFAERTWIPHLVVGSVAAGLAVLTAFALGVEHLLSRPRRRRRLAH
ncbi:MAG: hypothetical protein QM775_10255 [Pirellulales bacterium]